MERLNDAELLQRVLESALRYIHTSQPGEVESYDREAQTASIRPVVQPHGEALPIIPSCPVLWPRGGDGYLVFPLEAGDTGLIITCQVDIGNWRERRQDGAPGDERRHRLAASVFLPHLAPIGGELVAPAGASVLAGNDLRLGASDADEQLVGGNSLESALDSYVTAVEVFAGVVDTAITALGGDITAGLEALETATTAFKSNVEDSLSEKVRVKL